LRIEVVKEKYLLVLFKCLLSCYHYLGFTGTVGENLKYLVFDEKDNPLVCLLFGSAAWKTLARDNFIVGDAEIRKANLYLLTNNMQFLILPWVEIPHLASHILGKVAILRVSLIVAESALPSKERSFERPHCLFLKRDTKKAKFDQYSD
jgi:hypothetical protein